MSKFKDYHLYLGQPVKVWFEDENGQFTVERAGKLSWNHEEDSEWIIYEPLPEDDIDTFEDVEFRWKLILRRLSSMTEEELKEWVGEPALSFTDHYCKKSIKKVCHSIYGLFNFISFYGNVNSIPWLLSKGFDLFGLIDEGLAIDATTIKTND